MRTYLFVVGGCAAAVLAFMASCSGRVESTCFGDGSAFCDTPGRVATTDPSARPSPDRSPPAPECSTDTYSVAGHGAVCFDDPRETRPTPGTSCLSATECPSVCCVRDATGFWYPSGDFAGSDADASADADAEADASADATADANADAEADARPRLEDARRIYACGCGVCLGAVAACATANRHDVPANP
jgi:hypothetical protein